MEIDGYHYGEIRKGLFKHNSLVNVIYNANGIRNISNAYNYIKFMDYLIKNNPNANIIVSQSFESYTFALDNMKLLKKHNNLSIVRAMPYEGHDELVSKIVEYFGKKFELDHERLLYVSLKGDYQPTFTNNIVKIDGYETSYETPVVGYKKFKKEY